VSVGSEVIVESWGSAPHPRVHQVAVGAAEATEEDHTAGGGVVGHRVTVTARW